MSTLKRVAAILCTECECELPVKKSLDGSDGYQGLFLTTEDSYYVLSEENLKDLLDYLREEKEGDPEE